MSVLEPVDVSSVFVEGSQKIGNVWGNGTNDGDGDLDKFTSRIVSYRVYFQVILDTIVPESSNFTYCMIVDRYRPYECIKLIILSAVQLIVEQLSQPTGSVVVLICAPYRFLARAVFEHG